jgi:hypothetical protein
LSRWEKDELNPRDFINVDDRIESEDGGGDCRHDNGRTACDFSLLAWPIVEMDRRSRYDFIMMF